MPLLREVWVWPPSGFPDRPWVDDPDQDAFVKVSRAVCDRYGEALPGLAVTHRTSRLQLMTEPWDEPRDGAERAASGRVWTRFAHEARAGFEFAAVGVAPGFAALPLRRQQAVVLDTVHTLVTTMARARGLDGADRLAAAAEHVRAHAYGYAWDGPWHRSPRKGPFAARCRYHLEPDGYGRMTLEVAALDDAGRSGPAAVSAGHLAWTTSEGFRRSDRTLRWHDARFLTVVPVVGVMGLAGDTLHVGVSPGATPGDPPVLKVSHGAPVPVARRPTLTERAVAQEVPADDAGQDRLLVSPKVKDRLALALDGRTSATVVARLAGDPAPAVRRAVAARTTLGQDLLRTLADDPDVQVRAAVAEHPATPPDVVLRLAADPAWQVHFGVGDREDLTEELFDAMCRDGHDSLRSFLAGRDRLPLGPSQRLAVDPVAQVRIALARVSAHPEVLDRLGSDANRTVRETLRRRRG